MNQLSATKRVYLHTISALRHLCDYTHITSYLESKGAEQKSFLYLRSLLSIYDAKDMTGLDLPWWTFSAIERIEHHLKALDGEARVFEFGSGASTSWLARRASEVISIEHDETFYNEMAPSIEAFSHVEYRLIQPSILDSNPEQSNDKVARSQRKGYEDLNFASYVSQIKKQEGVFDLIIIDGRARCACLESAISKCVPNGLIVFDNSNRKEYQETIHASGLKVEVFKGLIPALPYPGETSILAK